MKTSKCIFLSCIMLVFLGLAYSYIPFNAHSSKIEIIDFGSLECPDSRDFYIENGNQIIQLYNEGIISYKFKPVDLVDFELDKDIFERMTKQHLQLNNLVLIFQNQDYWTKLPSLSEIQNYLHLNKTPIAYNTSLLKETESELKNLSIKSYPAIYVDGELIDYDISSKDLLKIINKKLHKK